MELPNVKHPNRVQIGACTFEIWTYEPVTDLQALTIARRYQLTHKLLKKHQGKVLAVQCLLDQEALARL